MSKITNFQPDQMFEIHSALERAEEGRFYHWSRSSLIRVDCRIYEVTLNIFERIYHCFLSLLGYSYFSTLFEGKTVEQLDEDAAREITSSFAELARGKGRWALHHVAKEGSVELIRKFLDLGCDIDKPIEGSADENGKTALHYAAENGHTDAIALLAKRGCTVNTTDRLGRTALHCATINGHTNVVNQLIDLGSSIDAADHGDTALHFAAENGHTDVIRLLAERGCAIDKPDHNTQETALHRAIRYDQIDSIRELLRLGCATDATDHQGRTALDLAREIDNPAAVEVLRDF